MQRMYSEDMTKDSKTTTTEHGEQYLNRSKEWKKKKKQRSRQFQRTGNTNEKKAGWQGRWR